jgi:hypothetical protein
MATTAHNIVNSNVKPIVEITEKMEFLLYITIRRRAKVWKNPAA